jgi:PAS domain S-box-containing protein
MAETTEQDLWALQTLTDTALSHLALGDLLDALLERITAILHVDNAAVLVLDRASQTLTIQVVRGPEEAVATQVRVPLGEGFAGRIAATREPLVVDDVTTFPVVNLFLREHVHSVVGVPLVAGGELLGVLHVGTVQPRHFAAHDVELLQQVADRMALAIDRARLYTREKEAREKLAERVAQLEAVMEAVPDALAVYDTNGTIMLHNTAADAQVARFNPQTPLGDTVSQRFAHVGGVYNVDGRPLQPEQWAVSRALRGEIFAGSDALTIAAHLPDGEPVYFSVTGGPLRDADGRIIGVATTARDITEQKRLERERAEQAEQLDRIFEHIADGVVVYDTQGHPGRLNAAARRILGLDAAPSEYAKLSMSDRGILYETRDEQGHPLAREEWPIMRVLDGQGTEPHTREMQLRTLDGREVDVISSAAPLRDENGHLIGAVTILHDQTEQKRLAREQEEAHAHELALEDTTRRMDEFLATASHDLRTPLTVVKSQMQIALRRFRRLQERAASSPEVLPNVKNAELEAVSTSLLEASHGTDRLTRLVTMLFDVAQARSGTLQLNLVPCDLAELVRRNVAAQQAAVPERCIELDLPEAGVRVEVDADRLDQVLTNYLTNALKYSPADQPVTVRLEVVENQAVVNVVDRGPGLSPEEQTHIWELFHRVPGIEAQPGSSEVGGSLGLGLHICKQLVELHPGGSVGVESVVGAGATFWFQLPLAS